MTNSARPPPRWRSVDFSELEQKLSEAKVLLEQAANMMQESDMSKVSAIANMHLDEQQRKHEHAIGKRYR